MFEMMVMYLSGGENRPLGRRKFRELPRAGEYVALIDDQGAAAYQVIAVLHTECATDPGVDLFVANREGQTDLFARLRTSQC